MTKQRYLCRRFRIDDKRDVRAGAELHCSPFGWNEYTTFCADFLNSTAMDTTQFILEVWL